LSASKVFLDTGIFIAALSRRDQHHKQAAALFGGDQPRWHTSMLVWSEAYSWFLHRHGEEAARAFRLFVDNLTGLTLLEVDTEHHRDACRMLNRMRGARLTYVDASSLAFLERHEIDTVWSTDHHLALTGAQVLPR
jgi:predicted nucleic acid-binding protein